MKIRNGYVSNSSSSSFCIIGYKVCNTNTAHDYNFDLENNQYLMIGRELCEGIDIIDLNKAMIKHLKDECLEHEYEIIQVLSFSVDSDYANEVEQIPEIILKPKVIFGTRSDNYTRTVAEFKHRYETMPF